MKCVVLLLSLLVLTPLTQACDASDAGSCIATYITDLVKKLFNNNTVCSVTQNVIACLNKACPSGVPKTYVDSINEQLQNLGSECDLSGLKTSGAGMDGCPSLRIIIAVAALVSVFLCG
ncbi:uncharacterized protein [Littorina saxatilis]|uniref:Uncharacterized protein n=1 Tax=Littorina saxatilis TaxID=31220 RepID=A0AAN9BTZ6_9CAEN